MAEDALRNIFRALGTVAVLAAVYFFLVRPVLDTTDRAFDLGDRAFGEADRITEEVFEGLEESGINNNKIKGLNINSGDVKDADLNPESFGALTPKEAEKIFDCMDDAGGDVSALGACGELSQALSSN